MSLLVVVLKPYSLLTLTVLLEEVPHLVRPFHPQLTRTFVKSASDPAAVSVRSRAATGLGELMKHQVSTSSLAVEKCPSLIHPQSRVDPLITELIGGVGTSDKDIAPSMVQALAAVCHTTGNNIGPAAKESIVELVEEAFAEGRSGQCFVFRPVVLQRLL